MKRKGKGFRRNLTRKCTCNQTHLYHCLHLLPLKQWSVFFSFVLSTSLFCIIYFSTKVLSELPQRLKGIIASLSRLNEYFLRGTQLFVTRGTLQNSYKWAVTPAGSPVVTPAGDKSDVEFVVCADKCQARLLNGLCCPEANWTRGERPTNTADR